MAIKRGLGRGLSALLPAEKEDTALSKDNDPGSGEISIALEKLKANPNQPRKNFQCRF